MEKIRVSRKELYDLVWSESLLSLAKKYKLSDNSLRKRCKKMNIPLPPAGYWQKKKHGYSVKKEPLPKLYEGETETILCYRDKRGNYVSAEESSFVRLKREIENNPDVPTKVPDRLTNPDQLIQAARKSLLKDKPSSRRYPGMVSTKYGELSISVTPQNVGRALRIMDTFIKLARARKHEIKIHYNQTLLIIGEEEFKIGIQEKHKIIPSEDDRYRKYAPSGVLAFRRKIISSKEWKDGKSPIEGRLPQIMASLELEAQQRKQERLYHQEQQRIREEKERIAREKRERREKEMEKFKELLNTAERWKQSKILRDYLNAVKSGSVNLEKESSEMDNWLKWATEKADWYDPLVNKEDPILGSYNDPPDPEPSKFFFSY